VKISPSPVPKFARDPFLREVRRGFLRGGRLEARG